MIVVKKKRFIITPLAIEQPERHKQFEIKLPAHVHKVSDIIITTFNANSAARLGTITLQTLNASDIFLKEDVYAEGEIISSELQTQIAEPGFGEDKAYISGRVPKPIEVNVEGDVGIIYGWYVCDEVIEPYTVNIYVIYEETEQIIEEAEDDRGIYNSQHGTADKTTWI
jgi:hypothetical protein